MAMLRVLAKQSRLQGATDLTQYGEGRASPKAFLTHHVANILTAIQAVELTRCLTPPARAPCANRWASTKRPPPLREQ